MATKYLSATASWSAASWLDAPAGSATTAPTTGDDADINGKTLTIDTNVTCDNIVGTTGTLAVSGNRTINANVGSDASGFSCTLSGASQTVTINGNVRGGITASKITVSGNTTTLNVNGNVVGGVASNIRGIAVTGTGTLTIVGNLTGGSAGNSGSTAVQNTSGTVTITGTVTAGAAGAALRCDGASTTTVNGNVTGASGVPGILTFNATPVLTIVGNVTAAASGGYGVSWTASAGTLTITGNLVESATTNPINRSGTGGTFSYTPTSAQTVTNGGITLYPAAGNTDPGIANIRSGTSYKYQGATQTGTLDVTSDNPSPGATMGIGF